MKSDEILSEITHITFTNVYIHQNINFEKDIAYKNVNLINFNNCIMENIDIIEQIKNKMKNNNIKVISSNCKCKEILCTNKYNFTIKYPQDELNKEDTTFNCIEPFHFKIEFHDDNKYNLIKNVILKNIKIIKFSNANINNIDFLANDTLVNLKKLYLDNNNIEDISIFDDDKIHFHELQLLELKNNPIKKGLEVLKKNFFQKCSNVELDLLLNELKLIVRFNSPDYNLDIFVNNLNEISNIFQKDKITFDPSSSEIAVKFKEIFNLTEEEYREKSKINNSSYTSSYSPSYSPPNSPSYNSPYIPFNVPSSSFGSSRIDEDEDEDGFNRQHIIIDNGSGYFKSGLSGDEGPRSVFPACIGYPKYTNCMPGCGSDFYVGSEAHEKRGVCKLKYPVEINEYDYAINWDDMEKIWGHIFTHELRVAPEDYNVMLTETPLNPKENKEKMAQLMFEYFNVKGLYIADTAALSIYSAGKFTGFVVDSGDIITNLVPVFDGFSLPCGITKFKIAGRDLTEYMITLLYYKGVRLNTTAEKEIAKNIKEKVCFLAFDYEHEYNCVDKFDYELPDGNHVILDKERIECPEVLFSPNKIGKYGCGIEKECIYSIERCDIDIKKDLYNCIVLSGGNTMYNGFGERLTKEIKKFAPKSMEEKVKVIASPERKFAAWIGGSILSSISTFESCWITKTDYEESGFTAIHRKCF